MEIYTRIKKTLQDHDSFKRYKLVGQGLAMIDRLPTVSLVLKKLQTRDKDCHIEILYAQNISRVEQHWI